MTRNLDQRVEVLAPVTDPVSKARLAEMIDVELADDTLAWELHNDGTWAKVPTRAGIDSHRRLQSLAVGRAHSSRETADVRTLPTQ